MDAIPGTARRAGAALGSLLTLGAVLLVATPAQAAPAADGRLLVGFKQNLSTAGQERLLDRLGGHASKRFQGIRAGRLAVVRPRGGRALGALRKALTRASGVAYAEPDYYQFASDIRVPNDPFYPLDWALVDAAADHDIDAPDAWGVRTSCAKVAVLDTGIDTGHPDLKDNVYKSSDKPNNGKDDDKNGFVDDTYGFNAIAGKGSGEDDNGHGSHVAGIVGGRGNNGAGSAGVCWSTKLLAVKFLNSRGKGSASAAIAGIEYAVKQGIKIINCSFSSTASSSALHDAVDYAQDHNALLVVAAGNDSQNIDKSPEYPAAYTDSNILTVAASDDQDGLASFSNYGSKAVDLAAPGDQIYSTYLGGGYKILSGTSMAAPYAAGVAGLLRKQESDATYSDLRYAIRHKIDPWPAFSGKVAYGGRLNAQKALAAIGSLVD